MPTLADLKPDPRNARRHTPRNVATIVDALHEVGAARSIVIDEDGVVLAGNATVEAAAEAGIERVRIVEADGEEIIAVRRSGLTPAQKTRLALFDNRAAELADWDPDVLRDLAADVDLSAFWRDDELAVLMASLDEPAAGLTDPDAVPEVPKEATTMPGDVWVLGRHRLVCGDATVPTDLERLMAGDRANLVWTDPPYGVAVGDKNKWLNSVGRSNRVERNLENDTLEEGPLLQLLRDAFSLATTYCIGGAAWYVAAPPGPLHLLFGQAMNELGVLRQMLIWVKQNSTFSPLGVTYHWQHEPIFYGWVRGGAHNDFTDRTQTTVWEIDRPQASPEHPTMKPVELVARAIEHSTRSGDVVLDMFGGSGTTMIACEGLERASRIVELDPLYCDVIVSRWEDFTGQRAVLATAHAEAAD